MVDDEWVSRCNQWEKCHSYRTRSEFQRLAASTYHVSRLVTASLLASLETVYAVYAIMAVWRLEAEPCRVVSTRPIWLGSAATL